MSSPHPKKTRLKTGCVCCRLRKKKCDETRPVCRACQRLDLHCSWPDVKEFAWRINLGLTSSKRKQASLTSKARSVSTSTVDDGSSEDNETLSRTEFSMSPRYALSPALSSETVKLDDPSHRLLELFVQRTAHQILGSPSVLQNPFINELIPVALSDHLIMNALLSVGGYPCITPDGEKFIEGKRLQCYVRALQDVKVATAEWSSGRGRDPVRLLLATHLLCLHETIQGNAGGSLMHHLRGLRHFARAVFLYPRNRYPSNLVGVVLESYAYCELCTSLRMLPGQDDIAAACRFTEEHLTMLREYRTFGSIFAGCTTLFGFIPFIGQLAMDRRVELSEDRDLHCQSRFKKLRRSIQEWSLLTDVDFMLSSLCVSADNERAFLTAGNVVRNALIMFLTSSFYHDVSYLRQSLNALVEETVELMNVAGVDVRTPFINVLFWPICVVGTYTTTTSQRERILSFMNRDVPLLNRVKKILRWVWEADDSVYGLQGLSDVMDVHQVDFPFG